MLGDNNGTIRYETGFTCTDGSQVHVLEKAGRTDIPDFTCVDCSVNLFTDADSVDEIPSTSSGKVLD